MQYESNRARRIEDKSTDTVFDICVATETRDVTRTINGEEYAEVLMCNANCIKLERLMSKAPLLFNHDWNDHLGVIEDVYVKDNTLRAKVRFSEVGRAGEMLAKVREGTLNCISVGYSVISYRLDQTTKTMIVEEWEPHEISVVTVPADIQAGFHRQKEIAMNLNETRDAKTDSDDESHLDEAVKAVEEAAAAEGETPAEEAEEVKEAIEAKRSEEEEPKEGESSEPEKPETKTEERKEADSEEEKTNVNTDAKEGETKTRKLQMSFNIDSMNTVNKEEVRALEAFDLMRAMNEKAEGKLLTGAAAEVEQEAMRKGERLKTDTAIIVPAHALLSRAHATQALSGTSVGTATTANGSALVNQSYRPDLFLEALRERSILGQLGISSLVVDQGVTKWPREIQQNVKLSGFISEDQIGPNQDYRFEHQAVSPKTFAASTKITRALMQQSNGSALAEIQNLLLKDAALALEEAVLRSVGSATTPQGIIPATAAGQEVKTGVADWNADVWAILEGFLRGKKVYGNLTAICSPAVLAQLKNVMIGTATGRYLAENGMIRDMFPVIASGFLNDITDKVFVGDYSNTKLLQYGSLQLDVDTTTHRVSGAVGLNLFADMDIAHAYPEAYAYAVKKV